MYISPEEFRPISEKLTGRYQERMGTGEEGAQALLSASWQLCLLPAGEAPAVEGRLWVLAALAAGLDKLFQHMHTHTHTRTCVFSSHVNNTNIS